MKGFGIFAISVLITLLFLIACNKYDLESGTPKCLNKKIKQLEEHAGNCDKLSLDEYEFQGEIVYLLGNGCCCDETSEVVNSECETLGYLNGFVGNRVINGDTFSKVAIFKRNIWQPEN